MTRPKCHLSEGDVLGRFVDLRMKVCLQVIGASPESLE